MNIAEFAIRHKTTTLVLSVVFLVWGAISFGSLGRLEDPEFTIKEALVITNYPGGSPTEVEEEVTDVLEEALQSMGQISEIRSTSMAGQSIIHAKMQGKYDKTTLPQVWDELRRKIGDVQGQLPPGAGPSIVVDDFGDVYGTFFGITGDGYSYKELKEFADFLKNEFLGVTDVAKVEFWGVQREVVYVEISRVRLSQLGISPQTIYSTLNRQNEVTDSGSVEVGTEYIRIQPTGLFASVDEMGELLIPGETGENLVALRDIATIRRGYQDPPRQLMRVDGKPAVGLGASVVQGGNVVRMGEGIKAKLKELEGQIPVGMELNIISYQSDDVTKGINGFLINLVEAVAIVIGVLVFFMGLRSALLIGAILVLAIFSTFPFMAMWAVNLERISLGALIIALGMLVDNAIVVTDGTLIGIQKGMDRVKAASQTVSQTAMPLLGATIVAIAAFAGIGLSQDSTGEYSRSLFQVILFSLGMSWVWAVTVTPLLCVMFLKTDPTAEGKDPYDNRFFHSYRGLLTFCLRRRWLVVGLLVGLLFLSGYGFGFVENSFFPDSARPQFYIDYWRPQGSHIEETATDLAQLEEFVRELDGVESVATFVGGGAMRFMLTYAPEDPNSSYGMLLVTVDDHKKINALIARIEQHLAENFPDSEPKGQRFVVGPGGGFKIESRFHGPDPTVLRQLSEKAQDIMRADPNTRNVRDDWRQRVKVVRPRFSEAVARRVGVTRPDLSDAIESVFRGKVVGLYREGEDLLPIITRAPEEERNDVHDLNNIQVWSPITNQSVPINQVVSGTTTEVEDALVQRQNRERTITAQCDPNVGLASPVFARIKPKIEAMELPVGYKMEWGGEYEVSTNAQTALFSKIPLIFAGMVLIVVVLFDALRQPTIIYLTLPLALIGVTVGLLVTGQPFGFMALLGLLSLSGMLIKNAIVLIGQIDLEMREGKPPYRAVVDSAVGRVRPVAMAAATTILGMLPLFQDAFFIAMAVTIMFGLAFATVLTLLVVPVLYAIFFRIGSAEAAA